MSYLVEFKDGHIEVVEEAQDGLSATIEASKVYNKGKATRVAVLRAIKA